MRKFIDNRFQGRAGPFFLALRSRFAGTDVLPAAISSRERKRCGSGCLGRAGPAPAVRQGPAEYGLGTCGGPGTGKLQGTYTQKESGYFLKNTLVCPALDGSDNTFHSMQVAAVLRLMFCSSAVSKMQSASPSMVFFKRQLTSISSQYSPARFCSHSK